MCRGFLLGVVLSIAGAAPAVAAEPPPGVGDATVIAVIDSAMNPYHWDFLASKMPQALTADPGDDLPLGQDPSTWLPGYPAGATRMDLKLEQTKATANPNTLQTADQSKWNTVKQSTTASPKVYWFPGTKVIGAMSWSTGKIAGPTSGHGVGTSSTAVGNLNGTCPECLLFFIQYGASADAEAAIEWAEKQPWIDAISNSYGFSLASRDRLYSKSNVAAQRAATERGQTIFFSAGNGQENAFVAPNPTLFSSQEGPDWIVTVGAVTAGADNYYGPWSNAHGPYSGTGKPADIAGIGTDYPDAYGATTVAGVGGGFGGTSNATPQIAGLYGRALWKARVALSGPSRGQSAGVIASGPPLACGAARAACELGDGTLTASELRTRLFEGAKHTGKGYTAGGRDPLIGALETPGTPAVGDPGEMEFLAVGHGFYAGREAKDREAFAAESDGLFAALAGDAAVAARPASEREWMVVDSYCRQKNWGAWAGGYFVDGKTALPGDDPEWPLRSGRERTCPGGPTVN